jgi:hypothetical protein
VYTIIVPISPHLTHRSCGTVSVHHVPALLTIFESQGDGRTGTRTKRTGDAKVSALGLILGTGFGIFFGLV